MIHRNARVLVLGVVGCLVFAGCYDNGAAVVDVHMHTPAQLMRANCGTCHGADGSGGVSWVDPTWFAPMLAGTNAAVIKGMVRAGRAPVMPIFGVDEISDAELDMLAEYIETLPTSFEPAPAFDATMFLLDEDPWFSPMQLSIQPGQTVRFVNAGATYHPLADLQFIISEGMDGIHSGNLGPGGEYYRTFEAPGVTTLLCGLHPYMKGEVHVGGAAPVAPVYAVQAPQALPAVQGIGEIWVLAQFQDWPGKAKDGVIQIIDAANWSISAQIPVGNNPHNLWFNAGSTEALVTNWFDVSASMINAATRTVSATYIVGAAPAHVTSDYNGTNWYMSMEGSNYVQAFTQASGLYGLGGFTLVSPRAEELGNGPHGIWYANGLLVTANSMSNSFNIIDAVSLSPLARLPAGVMPLGASANTSGTIGAAGNAVSASVSIYDLVNRVHIRDIPVSGGAIQVPFSPDNNKIYAATGMGVTVIDVMRAMNATTWPNPADAIDVFIPTGKGAHGIAFGNKVGGGQYAYVTHKFTNYVSVIDVASMTRVGDIPLATTTTGKVALAGATDTGGNGIAIRPNPYPWN